MRRNPKSPTGGFPWRDATVVLLACTARGLSNEQADEVWALVKDKAPGYPSAAARQLDEAIAAVLGGAA